ncbi:MAG TPA: RNA polymerase sigma factor SigJ [Solirubrobacteraceae bacterium]|jgi:RNA polymerase sigma-70 factor (ECF subfamily)|nr:RNA polymerase sigma factor SigJ [Solirubrobacteraceae bacterium]
MHSQEWQAEQFEQYRGHLRAVAQRMLGSSAEADDAVQEAWLRLNRSDAAEVENMRGWLTTVVSRICLDMLRTRRTRREESIGEWSEVPVVELFGDSDPEQEALIADGVGLALQVVLDTLSPSERLAFVLHDMFGVPFDEIGPIVDRNAAAARQLASRARRRVRGAAEPRGSDLARQRRVVEAFLAASRDGDFEALLEVLDPDVVFRASSGVSGPVVPGSIRGAEDVATLVLERGSPFAHLGRPAIVDGRPGAYVALPDRVFSLVAFTIVGDRVTEMDLLVDPDKLERVRVHRA